MVIPLRVKGVIGQERGSLFFFGTPVFRLRRGQGGDRRLKDGLQVHPNGVLGVKGVTKATLVRRLFGRVFREGLPLRN